MKLYTYFRSSAAYRVRIALNLKGIKHTLEPVNLLQGEQKSEAYLGLNPQGLLPALALDDGTLIAQSVAIMEYLEECFPKSPLLPTDSLARARVRSLVNNIACDIHPLNNISILGYLKSEFEADKDQVQAWYHHWIERGFEATESALANHGGLFCEGDMPSLADCCLIPQVFNAQRFKVSMDRYPNIMRVTGHCNTLDAFIKAQPAHQPDAPQ